MGTTIYRTNKEPYKVYTALLTQSGSNSVNYIYSEDTNRNLTIGVTYLIGDNTGGADFTNVGAPNNSSGTYFVATGTSAASWGNGDYVDLSYNTGAPVVTVLENTIGNIWWTIEGAYSYFANSNELFTQNKIWATAYSGADDDASFIGFVCTPMSNSEIRLLASGNNHVSIRLEIRVYN